jgi:hypothetical protein
MNGLNGETVLNAKDIVVGWVPGEEYGRKQNLKVTVSVRMEELTRQEEYETTEHQTVKRPLDISITTSVWRPDGRDILSGGATVEPLRELVRLADGFTPDDIAALLELSRHHLNGMQAACAHQVPAVPESGKPDTTYALDHTPACPETGYKYGSKWLLEVLPEHITPGYVRTLLHI